MCISTLKTKKFFKIIVIMILVVMIPMSVMGEDVSLDRQQNIINVLNATMEQLSQTVVEPTFGTSAGEWTVFSLARGEYFKKDNAYFTNYYNRIVDTVNETATSVNMNGALDKNKSTENSRLIVALSAIGKDATSVGDWNLVEAYSANGINWIKKQGINGTIWTLIALDSGNYTTSDTTIREQCVDEILAKRHNDGGWSLVTAKAQPSNVDITCMTLTALYPYRNQPAVAEACAEAIEWLSNSQLSTGGFPYGKGETSESCAWAIVTLTTWGINPDTDARFVKNGKSPIDNLLSYYVEADRMFAHQGTESNAMATDQACYALVAFKRFITDKPALYDYSDVDFNEENDEFEDETEDDKEDKVEDKLEDKIKDEKNDEVLIDKTTETTNYSSNIIDNKIILETKTEGMDSNIDIVKGISYSAVCLYTGDDVDLIPSTKKAVVVSIVGIDNVTKLSFNNGTNNYEFKYSAEISEKTGVATYIALVDVSIEMTQFEDKSNFTFLEEVANEITFSDYNGDGVINAQDALAAVDIWLRKTDVPDDDKILALDLNGDGRINSLDALSIVEAFVNNSEYIIVTKAATIRL